MDQTQVSEGKIEFPPFENFEINSVDHFQKSCPNIFDVDIVEFNIDEIIQMINCFLIEQLSNENLIYFPQEYLNMISFSPKAKDIYNIVKDQLCIFAQKEADAIISLESISEIANKWNDINKIISNISHYFNIFIVGQESFIEIVFSEFNKILSEKSELIQILHSTISDSFNNGTIQWFSIDCSDLLIKCGLFNSIIVINNLDINIETMEQLDFFVQTCHSLIPPDRIHDFFNFLTEKITDFTQFFVEVPTNWKYISSLYEIYDYKKLYDDFISKFTELVKSKFTAFNPFQIFDEIHSLGSTNLMFVIRNIATTLFNGQNEMFSVLLANYMHVTFISLKQPISNDRLILFDEFAQLSNGLFIRYHCHHLLKRLLNYNSVVFDADERFSKIFDQHHVIAIIDDFREKQRIVSEFQNSSQILTFSVFNYEFFSQQIESTPKFPNFFLKAVQSFENHFKKHCKNAKLIWDFSLMHVTFKVLNIPFLKCVKCNGIDAIILIRLAKNKKSMKIDDLCNDLSLCKHEITDAIESLNTFSLVNYNEDKTISLNTDLIDVIDEQIVIPHIPKVFNVANQTMVNTMQIEAMITRFVKLHPGLPKEEVLNQLKSFSNFAFTDQEFYNSLKSLIKKQIISPLDSSKALNLTFT